MRGSSCRALQGVCQHFAAPCAGVSPAAGLWLTARLQECWAWSHQDCAGEGYQVLSSLNSSQTGTRGGVCSNFCPGGSCLQWGRGSPWSPVGCLQPRILFTSCLWHGASSVPLTPSLLPQTLPAFDASRAGISRGSRHSRDSIPAQSLSCGLPCPQKALTVGDALRGRCGDHQGSCGSCGEHLLFYQQRTKQGGSSTEVAGFLSGGMSRSWLSRLSPLSPQQAGLWLWHWLPG